MKMRARALWVGIGTGIVYAAISLVFPECRRFQPLIVIPFFLCLAIMHFRKGKKELALGISIMVQVGLALYDFLTGPGTPTWIVLASAVAIAAYIFLMFKPAFESKRSGG